MDTILAVDFGTRRLGLAVGNTRLRLATPLDILQRRTLQQDLERILEIVAEYEVTMLLFGRPLNMDGSGGKILKTAENFANYLKKNLNLPLVWQDERLTSFEAEEMLKKHIPAYQDRKKMLDSVAAMVILNNYLENL